MIKSHRDLAQVVAGKSVLHLQSFGKDSVLSLEWLCNFAKPSRIVSLHYELLVPHPEDGNYFQYLRKRFPKVEFVKEPNSYDISRVMLGVYQTPADSIEFSNYEYDMFENDKQTEDLRVEHGCDLICSGRSRYESYTRATWFIKFGLHKDRFIYPLGNMLKKEVIRMIRLTGLKLHPVYKLHPGTLDRPSYYKMRNTFIARPEYKKKMYEFFPMLALDEYRYERLFK